MHPRLDARPIVVALAGSNGAGKSTFYHAHLVPTGLRYINADDLGHELKVTPYVAADIANALRVRLVQQRESFIFETVLSDPKRDKVDFLKRAAAAGYSVVVIFIGIPSALVSEERVLMRVTQGGHDVPSEKIRVRYPRTLANLVLAIAELPFVVIYDNTHFDFKRIAEFENGRLTFCADVVPDWFKPLLAD